ncbi:MAG: hypothetical protein DRI52_04470, partial [Chloroflexi bacterium]
MTGWNVKEKVFSQFRRKKRRGEEMKAMKILGLLVVTSLLFSIATGCTPTPPAEATAVPTKAPAAEATPTEAPTAAGVEVPPAPGFPIKVAMLFPMSGDVKTYGESSKNAV